MHRSRCCLRPQALTITFLVLALAVSLPLSAQVAPQQLPTAHLVVKQTASQSLTLIKPADPSFEGELDTYYPGLSDEHGYQTSIRPFLVIVENDTSLTVMAYAIAWTAHYTDGSSRPLQAVYLNRPLMEAGAMTYIPPGGVCLIGPTFNLTPEVYGGFESSFAQAYPASSFPPSAGLSSVDVGIDGVVYSDGSFIGPDTTRVLQQYVMGRFAARDEALAVLNLINSSTAPQSAVVAQLQKMFSGQAQWTLEAMHANQHTLLAMYVRGRGSTAADLGSIVKAQGLATLEKLLRTFIKNFGGDTNPSMFDSVYQNLSNNDPRVFVRTPWRPEGP